MATLTTRQLLALFDVIILKFLSKLEKNSKINPSERQNLNNLINSWKNISALAKQNQNELNALNEFKQMMKSIDAKSLPSIPEDRNNL
jgi:hypothetical protein